MTDTPHSPTDYRIETPEQFMPSHWDEDATYPVNDWKYEIDNDTTRLGYWSWVEVQYANARADDYAD